MILRVLSFLLPLVACAPTATWAQTAPVSVVSPDLISKAVEYESAVKAVVEAQRVAAEARKQDAAPAAATAPTITVTSAPTAAPPIITMTAPPVIASVAPPPTFLQQLALAAVPILGAILVPLVGWGLLLFQKRIGIQLTEQEEAEMAKHRAAVYSAVATGAGEFMTHLAAGTASLSDANANSPLIQTLASNALASVPEAVAAVGTSQNQMAHIINGAVGRTLSADPTIPTTPILALGVPAVPSTRPYPAATSVSAPTTLVPGVPGPAPPHATPHIASISERSAPHTVHSAGVPFAGPYTTTQPSGVVYQYRQPETDRALFERIAADITPLGKGQALMAATLADIQTALQAMQPELNALSATVQADAIPLLRKLAAAQGGQIDPTIAQAVVDALTSSTSAMKKLHDDLSQAVVQATPPAA